ncbi:TPA: phage anti-RecBCD protein [Escherichia coli]
MRNINPEEAILIKPIGKPLPFKSKDWLAWDARAKKGTVVTTDKWDVIRPFRKATYTHFPEIDPRLRNYRSRYGAISND